MSISIPQTTFPSLLQTFGCTVSVPTCAQVWGHPLQHGKLTSGYIFSKDGVSLC